MKKPLLLMGAVCLLAMEVQLVQARDVQLRPRSGDTTSSLGVSRNENTRHLSTEERVKRLERILDSNGGNRIGLNRIKVVESDILLDDFSLFNPNL